MTRLSRPSAWKLFRHNHIAFFGFCLFLLVAAIALAAPILPLSAPNDTAPAQRLLRPLSEGHLLGTDHLGRDLLSRLIWGARVSISVGLSATLIASVIGSALGLIAGFAGGRTDNVLMRGVDMLMAFPYILLALAIVAALGPGLSNALYAIALVNIPFFARNIRGVTLSLTRRDFVDAAKLSGKGPARILLTEILPNVAPIIVITMSTTLGWMILETAGLSFLGLGAQPPQADLGAMLGEGRKLLFTAPHVSVIPGLMIFALVMSVNLIGDGVRDVLDPKLKSGSLTRPAAMTAVQNANVQNSPDMSATQDALAVRDLQTEFLVGTNTFKAVDDVSFELGKGECLGLVGESGSGKSVTAMSLLRLAPTPPGRIVGGQVWRGDENLLSCPQHRIQTLRGGEIAYIFQDPLSSLHPLFSVGAQIAEAIRAHQSSSYAEAWRTAVALLEQVRLPNPASQAHSYPHELSGGMRQRVCIAMALANRPRIIVADEPTTALDVTVQAQVLKLMNQQRRQNEMALLFITHDFGVVSEICDRVAVMYAGRIVEVGSAGEVLNKPAHPYTRLLIECVPIPGRNQDRLPAIPGSPPALNNLPAGCAFADRCPFAEGDCRNGDISLRPLGENRFARCIKPLWKTAP
ncbi:ABC transporter permease subunit [Hahella sp. KA22]|uniref:dipeptide/oligopeptide/nickel ABC transporter permease/ATP-binding protein n=1 Tax=Hahella sp. KA22 TaxID=1628392 RepID=UPI000FDE852B|nr:dipeptide/oligopeptide/nickel ABC transporter permease/ATP-binding protein [Hahella sp. KA22]AZZ89653.1 dipeptide/oligopeptide/nickel ABC transporter permease/ATP-binding protein [Hahella sp. KA22]QAY53023.1 ABC transporter permease subunit [Hahella sp. KA22]